MVKPDLDAIEARANAATEGPWKTSHSRLSPNEVWVNGPEVTGYEGELCPADASFIAAARTDVPALVAYARRLEQDLAQIHEEMGWNRTRRDTVDE